MNKKWSAADYLGHVEGVPKILFLLKNFYETPIPKYYEEQVGYFPWVFLDFLTMRHQDYTDKTTLTGWHVDDNFFGGSTQAMTAWLATDDCGEIRPGLDFTILENKEKMENYRKLLQTKPRGERSFSDAELANYRGCCRIIGSTDDPLRLTH